MHGMGHTFHWQLLLDNKLRAWNVGYR
jgi:hypothetical protein